MALGLIVKSGRVLTAKLLMGQAVEGITHCAIGDGDETFTEPQNPPAPDIEQTALKNERASKRFYKRTFLKDDAEGALVVNGVRYLETGEGTNTIGTSLQWFATNDGCETWKAMTIDDTRPIDEDWTEYTLVRTFSDPQGNKVRYKAELTGTVLTYPRIHTLGATLS